MLEHKSNQQQRQKGDSHQCDWKKVCVDTLKWYNKQQWKWRMEKSEYFQVFFSGAGRRVCMFSCMYVTGFKFDMSVCWGQIREIILSHTHKNRKKIKEKVKTYKSNQIQRPWFLTRISIWFDHHHHHHHHFHNFNVEKRILPIEFKKRLPTDLKVETRKRDSFVIRQFVV